MSTKTDEPPVRVPPRQLRDGVLLIVLGLVVARWIGYGVLGVAIGFVVAVWGLALAGNALWVGSRRRRRQLADTGGTGRCHER